MNISSILKRGRKPKYVVLEVTIGDILTVKNGKKSTITLNLPGEEHIKCTSGENCVDDDFDEDFFYEDELYNPEDYSDEHQEGADENGVSGFCECTYDYFDQTEYGQKSDDVNCYEHDEDTSEDDNFVSEDGYIDIGSIQNFKLGTDTGALNDLKRLNLYGSLICLDGIVNIKEVADIEKFSGKYFRGKNPEDKVIMYVDREGDTILISNRKLIESPHVRQIQMTLESVQCLFMLDLLNRDLTIYKC